MNGQGGRLSQDELDFDTVTGGAEDDFGSDLESEAFERDTLLNGRYRVQSVLGRGGMGLVYRVDDRLNPDRALALKTILGRVVRPALISQFEAEFRIMTGLRHPNVARVFDFEQLANTEAHFFTMEFVPGANIYQATEGKSWSEVVELVVEVCRALSYIHSRQLVHFDIKPDNIRVAGRTVKVLDFGVSDIKSNISLGRVPGTPMFMSPELIQGDSHVDHRADLYALGVTLYLLLCREAPFDAPTVQELLMAQCLEPIVFTPESERTTPKWLRQIVLKLTEKQAAERYRTANAVIDDINRGGGSTFEIETEATKISYVLSSQFVGRDRELTTVERFIDDRLHGEAGEAAFLLVGGPSGSGKSRLMREVRYRAQLSRVLFVESSCYEGAPSDFGPIVSLLSRLITLAGSSGKHEVVRKYQSELGGLHPTLEQLLGVQVESGSEEPKGRRERLVAGVASFLVELGGRSPFVAYLNDLQWADSGTIAVLRRVTQLMVEGERCTLALLATARDDELEATPARSFLDELEGGGRLRQERLGALGPDDVSRVVASMLGTHAPSDFVVRLAEETAGNPFFVQEVMRVLIENGSVFLENGEWSARTAVSEIEIPTSITSVFTRRVAMLPKTGQRVLEVLSTCAGPVDFEVLSRASGFEGEELHGALSTLEQRQMITLLREGKLRYQTEHDRMRETVYDSLSDDSRRGLHASVLSALEEIFVDDLDSQVFELAHHSWAAGEHEKTSGYCLAAGRRAQENYAVDLALQMLGRAAETLRGTSWARLRDRCDCLHRLSQTLRIVDRMDEALDAAAEAMGLLDELEGAVESLPPPEREESRRQLLELRSELHFLRGNLCFPRGDIEGCLREHGDSLRLAREAKSPSREIAALGGLGDAEYVSRRMISSHARFRTCVDLCKELGMADVEAANIGMLGHTALYFRPLDEALQEARVAAARAAEVGHSRGELNARVALLVALTGLARGDDVLRELVRAQELVRSLGAWRFGQACLMVRGALAAESGNRVEAETLLREGLDVAERSGFGFWGPTVQSELARVLEDPDAKRRAIEEGEQRLLEGSVGHNHLFFYPNALEVALDLDDSEMVERFASTLEKTTEAEELPWTSFSIRRARALVQPHDAEVLQRLIVEAEEYGYVRAAKRIRDADSPHEGPVGSCG